jgi:hypothetical protein
MRQKHAGCLGLMLMVVVGCYDTGPSPRPLAKPVEDGHRDATPTRAQKLTKPAQTDPAAEKVLDTLLKTHTNDKLELISPIKTHALTRKGQFFVNGTPQQFVWHIRAIWPDRYRVEMEWADFGGVRDLLVQNGSDGWKMMRSIGMGQPTPFTVMDYSQVATDAYAEWMLLLVPLLDASTRVAVLAPEGTAGTVWVWVAERPAVLLHIDQDSGLLTRVDYEVPEIGGAIAASLLASEHKPINGVLLPSKVEYTRNNQPTARWTSSEIEFPKDIPLETFTKP